MSDIIFSIGGLSIYSFGAALIFAAVIFALVTLFIESKWIGKDKLHVLDSWWGLLVAGLVGGKLFDFLLHPPYSTPFWERPFSGFGAVIAMIAFLAFEMRHRKGVRMEALDVFMTSLYAALPFLYSAIWFLGLYKGAPQVFDFRFLPVVGVYLYQSLPHMSLHPLGIYFAIVSLLTLIAMVVMWIRDVRVGMIFSVGTLMFAGMTVAGEFLRFPDDIIVVQDSIWVMAVFGALFFLFGVLAFLSTFVKVEKVHHVVHHRYEEDI